MTKRGVLGLAMGVSAGALLASRALRSARAIDFKGKSVVIVGGSRGLGLVLARELGAQAACITILARDPGDLERAREDLAVRGIRALAIRCDITDQAQAATAIERVIDAHGVIDVLINDAGVIQVGPLAHMSVADFEAAMATHFWGPLSTILAALPHMRRAGAKRIVNISSIGGKIAVPHLLPYCASKFALTGLSDGLGAELAREGFAVTTVCPGLMRTGSTYNARFKGQHRLEFAWFHMSDAAPGLSIDARRAARQIVDACRHGDSQLVITPAARAAVLLNAACHAVMRRALATANALLPRATGAAGGNDTRLGWQSVSRYVPSPLTALADRATVENNELPS